MGAAASSLEGNSCEEQVQFWTLWNQSTRDQRHTIGVGISRKIDQLMKSEITSAGEFKKELAKYVKTVILKKPMSRRARRTSSRQR
jgi:hypothetical protein